MIKVLIAFFAVMMAIQPSLVLGQEKPASKKESQAKPGSKREIVISGMLYCSVKQEVRMPFKGLLTAVKVAAGSPVRKKDVLAVYTLDPDERLKLLAKVRPSHIYELELRMIEIEEALLKLKIRGDEIKSLVDQDLAPAKRYEVISRQVTFAEKQKEIMSQRLGREKLLHAEELAVISQKLGRPVNTSDPPTDGLLMAPMDGHVIWIGSQTKKGAMILPGQPVFQICVMNPLTLVARVHEIEAVRLKKGDEANLYFESLPEKKIKAKIKNISWAPVDTNLTTPSYYLVDFEIPNHDLRLREGLKVRITFN